MAIGDLPLMIKKLTVFLILSLLTILAYCTVDRHREVGEQLLANNYFVDGLQGWQVSGAKSAIVEVISGLVKIKLQEPESLVQLSQKVDPRLLGDKVVLRGSLKTVGVVGGVKAWQKGRIVLVQYVEGKPVYSSPHVLVALDGTRDWAEYSLVIPILSNATEIKVGIQLSKCTGELQVKELSLYRVLVNPLYRVIQWLIFGLWALFMICVFLPGVVGSFEGRKSSAFVVLVIVAIILGTTVPASLRNEAKSEVLNYAKISADKFVEYGGIGVAELKVPEWLSVDITKVGHFLLFGLLGGILYFRQGGRRVSDIFADIGILACGSELMQLFVEGRSALVGDVVIDFAGAGCAVLLATNCTNEH